MAVPNIVPQLTEAEYLDLERAAPFKSEFYAGEVFAMAGGSAMHSLIAANLIGELGTKLRGRPCKAFTGDLRVKIAATGLLTYPDVSVICRSNSSTCNRSSTICSLVLTIGWRILSRRPGLLTGVSPYGPRRSVPIHVALAYVLAQPFPSVPLIGPRTLDELEDSLKALDIRLTAEDVAWLDNGPERRRA